MYITRFVVKTMSFSQTKSISTDKLTKVLAQAAHSRNHYGGPRGQVVRIADDGGPAADKG